MDTCGIKDWVIYATKLSLVLDRLGIKSKLQNELSFCTICPLSKAKQLPLPTTINKTQVPFELGFLDMWGPAHTTHVMATNITLHL